MLADGKVAEIETSIPRARNRSSGPTKTPTPGPSGKRYQLDFLCFGIEEDTADEMSDRAHVHVVNMVGQY